MRTNLDIYFFQLNSNNLKFKAYHESYNSISLKPTNIIFSFLILVCCSYQLMDYKKASILLKQLQNQYLEMIIKNVGKGQFSDDTYEEVQPQKQEDEDFGFQQEDQAPVREETQLYKKSIGLGPEIKPVINHQQPNLHIIGYNFVYGCNIGNKTFQMIGSSICRAVGVNIFCQNKIYSAHNQKITYLCYDNKQKILISGTQGKCAQVMLWKCQFVNEKAEISPLFVEKQKKLLNLPLSSLGVGFVWYHGDGMVAVITKFNLHQNSTLYIFDTQLEKRIRSDIKLEKVIDVCTSFSTAILLTETGIWRLQISAKKQCKLVRILEETMIVVMKVVKIMDQLLILGGKMDGSLKMISLQNKNKVRELKNHQNFISCIRLIDQSGFLTLGKDSTLNIYQVNKQDKNFIHLEKIQLKQICVNAFGFQENITCVSKSGQLIQFSKQNSLKYQKVEKNIDQKMLYSSSCKYCPRQHWIYDKFLKKHIYSISNSNKLVALSINENKQLNSLKEYPLSYEPFNIDIVGNIAAYTHRQTKLKQKLKTQTNSTKLQNNQITAQFLVLEDYTTHKILTEMIIDVSPCTKLKFSPEGEKLAMGFQDGRIFIYDCNKASSISKLKESKHHSKAIENVIWSSDSKFLKSISKKNLLYFDLQKKGQQMAPVFIAKSIKDAEWIESGKFDWTNHKLWQDHRHEADQVKDIKNSYQHQFVLMQDGKLKVFRNPAGKDGQQLIRLFQGSYDLQVLQQEEDGIVNVVVMGEGIVFSMDIGWTLEQDEQQINETN